MAVSSARRALDGWSIDTTMKERRYLVSRLLFFLYKTNAEEMARLVMHEMGAPIDFAHDSQVAAGADVMEQFYDDTGRGGNFEESYVLDEEMDTIIFKEPIGVVAAITPWNWPLNQIALKVIPALLVGCTVILKPSERAPLSALFFAELMHRAGFPPGVFQLVNGHGPYHAGEWLASHPNVDMVSFTGSTRGGGLVSLAAAPTSKRVSLEMGGKRANLIFDHIVQERGVLTELIGAVRGGVWDVMTNSGQTCDAPTRMLVHAEYWDHALREAKRAAEGIRVGPAHFTGDHIGPVVSKDQYDRVQGYTRSGIEEGATLLTGGPGRPAGIDDDYRDGYYVRPTIFANCKPGMRIWEEEIFGPVLCMAKFSTEEEAVRLANDSVYGLARYVQSYDGDRRRRLARRLKVGMIIMNQAGMSGSAPFGGVKQSGNSREGGIWGLEDFCTVKAISGLTYD